MQTNQNPPDRREKRIDRSTRNVVTTALSVKEESGIQKAASYLLQKGIPRTLIYKIFNR